MLHVFDDRALVEAVSHGLTELRVLEPFQLPGRDLELAYVRVPVEVHVECEERRPESGASKGIS